MIIVRDSHEQLFDSLSEATEKALRASIRRFGVLVPIVVDQHGRMIDGRHRKRIADELGVECPVEQVHAANLEIARAMQRTLNADRRHLSGEQLREHILYLAEQRDDDGVGSHSMETIAEVTGVSPTYVRKTIDDSETRTSADLPEQRRSATGQVRPARHRAPAAPAVAAAAVPVVTEDEMALHPAAQLYPELTDLAQRALTKDIRDNGQQEPIVVTPDGLIIDGRARWRACAELGIRPVTRVETGSPWTFALTANAVRANLATRAIAVARTPIRHRGTSDPMEPPRRDHAAALVEIGTASVQCAQVALRGGVNELLALAVEGLAPLASVEIVSRRGVDEQLDYVRRVRGGESWKTARHPLPPPRAHVDNRRADRHRVVGTPAIDTLIHNLDAVGIVIDGAIDGLDPGITAEDAARLLRELSKAHRSYRRLVELLKDRKEPS